MAQRFVFLDLDAVLDGLRRADHLVARVAHATATRDLRLHMKSFTTRVGGADANGDEASRWLCAVYAATSPMVAQMLTASGWTVEDREKSPLTALQKALAGLLLTRPHDTLPSFRGAADLHSGMAAAGPKTLVVATSDASDDVVKGRFVEIIATFLEQDSGQWNVEIHTWSHTLCDAFVRVCHGHALRVQIKLLDEEIDGTDESVAIVYAPLPKPAPVVVPPAKKGGDSPLMKPSPHPTGPKAKKTIATPPAGLAVARLQRIQSLREGAPEDAYSPHGRLRYILMDADNIFLSLRNATHLHPPVANAQSALDLRIHFKKLTNHVCNSAIGFKDDLVREMKAMHFATSPFLVRGLTASRWTVEQQRDVTDASLHDELRRMLRDASEEDAFSDSTSDGGSEETPAKRTLVLVTGDGNDGAASSPPSASFRGIVDEFLAAGWSVEIHAWSHALNPAYIDLMETQPQLVSVRPLDDGYTTEPWEARGDYQELSDVPVSTKLVYASPDSDTKAAAAAATPKKIKTRASPTWAHKPPTVTLASAMTPLEAADALSATGSGSHSDAGAMALQARIRSLEAQVATATRDKNALAMQMEMMTAAYDARVQQLQRERWDAFGASLRAITCRKTGTVLDEPVLLACCRVVMSKSAAVQLRDDARGCPGCAVVNFKTISVPALDEITRAVMDHAPSSW